MAPSRPTRLLIADDSAVMRSLLRSVVSSDPGLEVAGTAGDGNAALAAIETLHPDLVLLDVEMPVMDGLLTLKTLRTRGHKMPVIMCSSSTQRGARVTIDALAGGASDYVAKPAGQINREAALHLLAHDLLPKIHALSGAGAPSSSAFTAANSPTLRPSQSASLSRPQVYSSVPSVLVIGVSTGGPAALDVLLPALPQDFPLPVLIVQHMPELFTKLLAERLDQRCRLRVTEAIEGDMVHPGNIHVARGNWHMEVLAAARSGLFPTLHLNQAPLENHCRPAVDVLFRSAARVYGSGVLAVVLTGMGSDGLGGCRIIRAQGGAVLAQDQATSTIWGMPGAVANAGLAQRVLPLQAIAGELLRLASRSNIASGPAREIRETVA
jgi:two-component system, chemotaxis family, protein-glutamate methylesterase/glutaminase